ncbi:MAG TPA: hypothetical protein VK557_20975 [Pyrinomonadaceae bacterium]|nr:hypothetical protein [Pyrinomonadaceae bacterium]
MRERFQESLLGGVFRLAAIAKEPVRHVKDSGAVPAHDLGKGRFIFCTCKTREFKIRGLIVAVRQKRSLWSAPAERSGDGALDELSSFALCRHNNQLEAR